MIVAHYQLKLNCRLYKLTAHGLESQMIYLTRRAVYSRPIQFGHIWPLAMALGKFSFTGHSVLKLL